MNNTNSSSAPGNCAVDACPVSAISWSAVIAGAFTAAAVSLALLFLGSGLGLATASPYAPGTVAAFTAKAAIWLIIMQWAASALGGFLTGRLRIRWTALHADEVFFRDTAHGFLTWALATVLTATLLASAGAAVIGGGAHTAAMMMPARNADRPGAVSEAPGVADPLAYIVDGLYRTAKPAKPEDRESRMETTRIFAVDLKNDNFPDADKIYLAQSVAARTGLSENDATARVNDAIAQATADREKTKAAADSARKVSATVSFFTFLSMLVGAFIACVAAALGGKVRDQY